MVEIERDECGVETQESWSRRRVCQIKELKAQLHRAQCEVTELQNTLRLERELRERYEVALKEILQGGMGAYSGLACASVAREALKSGER